jgi:hypothetical protein
MNRCAITYHMLFEDFPLMSSSLTECRLMLDPSEEREFDFETLITNVAECKRIAKQVQNAHDTESAELLTRVATDVQQRTLEFGKLFREKAGESGTLSFQAVVSC